MTLCFLFLFLFCVYRDDVLCWLLSCPFSSSVCFLCLSPISGLIWFGSVHLVTTAEFVAHQLMRDKQQQQQTSQAFHLRPRSNCIGPISILRSNASPFFLKLQPPYFRSLVDVDIDSDSDSDIDGDSDIEATRRREVAVALRAQNSSSAIPAHSIGMS